MGIIMDDHIDRRFLESVGCSSRFFSGLVCRAFGHLECWKGAFFSLGVGGHFFAGVSFSILL